MGLPEKLMNGVIEHPKRWSGDTHDDMGGSVDYDATDALMSKAAHALLAAEELAEKCQHLLNMAQDTFSLGDANNVLIEGDNGEKCFIISSEVTCLVESTLAAYRRATEGE